MPHDRARIEAALAPLVGLPLWRSSRGADMQGFGFGAKIPSVLTLGPLKGEAKLAAEYALHVQCSWRITGPGGLVVGRRDLYRRSRAAIAESPDVEHWEWDVSGASRRDELIKAWIQQTHLVRALTVGDLGSFALTLFDGESLEVFPDASEEDECWRVFSADEAQPHFVVLGAGIED